MNRESKHTSIVHYIVQKTWFLELYRCWRETSHVQVHHKHTHTRRHYSRRVPSGQQTKKQEKRQQLNRLDLSGAIWWAHVSRLEVENTHMTCEVSSPATWSPGVPHSNLTYLIKSLHNNGILMRRLWRIKTLKHANSGYIFTRLYPLEKYFYVLTSGSAHPYTASSRQFELAGPRTWQPCARHTWTCTFVHLSHRSSECAAICNRLDSVANPRHVTPLLPSRAGAETTNESY